jgi:hypothetical protein
MLLQHLLEIPARVTGGMVGNLFWGAREREVSSNLQKWVHQYSMPQPSISSSWFPLQVLLLHQIKMDHIQEVLCGVQDQKGNLELQVEEAELLQHLHEILGV